MNAWRPEEAATDPTLERPAWTTHLATGVRPDAIDLLDQGTVVNAWLDSVSKEPGRLALLGVPGMPMSNGQVEAESRAIARRLAATGLGRGHRFVMSARASVEFVLVYIAAMRLGLVVVPVNTAYRREDIEHIVGDAAPSGGFVDSLKLSLWQESFSVRF